MISKELLSEICQTNLMSLGELEIIDSDICLYDCHMQPSIYMCWNIYELAHKCKEWALNIGYSLESITNRSCIMGNNYEYYASVKIHKATNSMIEHNMDEDTETKAIFKACQWILDNKDSK